MKPAISYSRVSTRAQSEEGASLQTQAAAIQKYAAANGLTVGREFAEIYSGAELYDRPLLNELRDLVKSGQYGAVICYAIDRLSRDPVHLMILAEEFDRGRVELRFVTEALDDTPEGRLIQYVRGYAAQVEREKIRERAIRGRRNVVLSGRIHNAGTELYGYRRDKSRGVREIYEPEAKVVRRIFDLTIAGHGQIGIARLLNEESVPSPSAGKRTLTGRAHRWAKSEIRRILTDSAYYGETVAWQWRTYRKSTMMRRPESERIKLPEGTTPPIVTFDIWAAARAATARNRGEITRNETRRYLLRGFVWCATCGARMYSDPSKGERRYRCSSRQKSGACGGRSIVADIAEEWAWEELAGLVADPKKIERAVSRRSDGATTKRLALEIDQARKQAARLETQAQRLAKRMGLVDDDAAGAVADELSRVKRELADLNASIVERQRRLTETGQGPDHRSIAGYLARLMGRMERLEFYDKQLALRGLGVRVFAEGKPGEGWRLEVYGGEEGQSAKCCARDAILVIHYRKPKGRKAA